MAVKVGFRIAMQSSWRNGDQLAFPLTHSPQTGVSYLPGGRFPGFLRQNDARRRQVPEQHGRKDGIERCGPAHR